MNRKRLVKKQMKYIFNELSTISIYNVLQSSEDVSITLVKKILENNFTNGPDMKAVLCLFDTLLTSFNVEKCKGMYKLTTSVQKWTRKMDKINVKSSQGLVYFCNIISDDLQVVIKIPKTKRHYDDLVREYFIGITAINNLRYTVPNFMYTLGAFIYPPEDDSCPVFVVYEKIPGITLEKAIRSGKLTFEDFLNIFVQLLLALEVAQRSCSFCHYDLHINNIILRPTGKEYGYTIVLDEQRYDITIDKYLPMIIDFGIASVQYKNRAIGSYHYSSYGMEHYLIQGADMYKLLYYSYIYSSGTLQRQIGSLFLFYGQYDPYKVLITGQEQLRANTKEYIKKIVTSRAATYTPLEFASWIFKQAEFNITKVKMRERNIYLPLKYESTSKKYADIFQKNGLIQDLDTCAPSSYIMLKYMKKILDKYPSGHLPKKIDQIRTKLKKNRIRYIKNDRQNLFDYKSINCPNEFQIRDHVNQIFSFTINDSIKAKSLIDRFISESEFVDKLSPYLQYLYTIKEMRLEKVFKDFISQFTTSRQYKFYIQLGPIIERARRWSTTLKSSF